MLDQILYSIAYFFSDNRVLIFGALLSVFPSLTLLSFTELIPKQKNK